MSMQMSEAFLVSEVISEEIEREMPLLQTILQKYAKGEPFSIRGVLEVVCCLFMRLMFP
jgi:hypothetical protein